uniref:non-specific serine/threonine protein kinase n=1 Tax=Kalanchoe fedtschenkoi TaxID=63787 RepID=A0A7N1A3Q9_KALFE
MRNLCSIILLALLCLLPGSGDRVQCDSDALYSSCRIPYPCGDLTIVYPFWGADRLQHCGPPDFKLDCGPDRTTITIGSVVYRVNSISFVNQTLRIARWDYVESICPDKYANTTLDSDIFTYSRQDVSVTLLYDCVPVEDASPQYYPFNCSKDPTDIQLAYTGLTGNTIGKLQASCKHIVEVPVSESAVDSYPKQDIQASKEVLNQGFDVVWASNYDKMCNDCELSGGRCGYDVTTSGFSCHCVDRSYNLKCGAAYSQKSSIIKKLVKPLGFSACGLTFIVIVIIMLRAKKAKKENSKVITDFLRKNESLILRRYKYWEIKKITRSFRDKLGQGGFGSVYKGVLKDGRQVAVKILSSTKCDGGEDFMNEVASISRTSHVNIVSLIGFCTNGSKRALIYEFMANGSLEKFIYEERLSGGRRVLTWDKLHSIAVGIAQGLEYLHRGCNTRIVHFDIKPHNILLDEDFCPKISDFELAKVCPRKDSAVSMLGARGTVGYIAPEQVCLNFGQVSYKSDVYSYGMMILEMVGGRKNVDAQVENASEVYFPRWIYKRLLLDQELALNVIIDEEDKVQAKKMIIVGLWCIQTDPAQRPPMSQVVEMLQGSIESLPAPPKPYLYSPPSSSQHSLAAIWTSSTFTTVSNHHE